MICHELPQGWNTLHKEVRGSVYQSETWAKVKGLCGDKLLFICEYEGTTLKGGFLCEDTIKSFPVIGKKKILFSEGNPLALTPEVMNDLLSEYRTLEKKEGYFYGQINPCVLHTQKEVFTQLQFKHYQNSTLLISLEKEQEELWKNLEKKSARWGANFAEKNGLHFCEANEEDLDEFYSLYKQTAQDGGFEAEKFIFLKELCKSDISQLFMIRKGKTLLAGGLVLIDKNNNYSILNMTSCSEEGMKLQAMPFLYWNIILYSKSLGMEYLDLGGYDREAFQGNKTYNINKFKVRFGGEIVEQPVFTTNIKYPLFRKILKKGRTLKRITVRNKHE